MSRWWPFTPGDKVQTRGNWGPLVDPLRTHSQKNPGAVYTVHDVADEGRWLSVRDEQGHVYEGMVGPAYGPTYFRIAGECGEHCRGFRDGAWLCLRCDMPMDTEEATP